MSKALVFNKKEHWQEVASEFADKIKVCLRKDYSEEVPAANDRVITRYRIDPKYLGYNGIAWPINSKSEILDLIADELKQKLNNPHVRVVYDDTMPRIYTHFLIYI